MKKLLKNKKGFSLVELLIVIAIMGVLAVIAFSMFSGIVANSTRKADEEQANNIQKALTSYMVDTGDTKLEQLKYDSNKNNVADEGDEIVGKTKDLTYDYVIQALQLDQVVDGKTYIAYLNPKTGTIPSTKDFDVRWSKHIGYSIRVYPSRAKAEVVPIESGSTLTTVLEIIN
ncbi:MAG TPA: type II secretion system protein [Acetivibrio clariflavus]|nr:type II secretion system protein [Acetivibrio clariflavus]